MPEALSLAGAVNQRARLTRSDQRQATTKASTTIPMRMTGVDPDAGASAGAAVEVGGRITPARFEMLAEQMIRAPPPLAEPLHWLILTPWAGDFVPVAVQVEDLTRPPPLPEPLHWVIVAPEVVAGKGMQAIFLPPPPAEPTHWSTEAFVAPKLSPTNSFVTFTLQRSVPPPPLIELLHWVTAVTGLLR